MSELEELKEKLVEEIAQAIYDLAKKQETSAYEVQPPESVIQHAAEAAASVLLAFERGYRMND
jgi:hypothetical protein